MSLLFLPVFALHLGCPAGDPAASESRRYCGEVGPVLQINGELAREVRRMAARMRAEEPSPAQVRGHLDRRTYRSLIVLFAGLDRSKPAEVPS